MVLPLQKCLCGSSKASRECASRKLARILDVVVDKNDYTSWVRLLRFTASCLRYPGRGGRGSSLATAVNRQPREETDLQANEKPTVRTGHSASNSPNDPAYSARTTRKAEAVAALAEERKVAKYVHLTPVHLFSPAAVETTGVFGPHTKALLKDLVRQMTQTTGEEAATTYLFQRLLVAVQRATVPQ